MNYRAVVLILFVFVSGASYADETDSLDTPSPLPIDTNTVAQPDSLTEAEKALARFQERRQQFASEKIELLPRLSFVDTTAAYFLSSRWDVSPQVERSFFHDAGDYFRSNPSFFVTDLQPTPMRKTVAPFGLAGDRLNLLVNGRATAPFEHIPEPDGLIDLNDIPTALDDRMYIVAGPTGMLFGGAHPFASLVTFPDEPSDDGPSTAIFHDKGSYNYNFTRGRYSRRFKSGREIDMLVSYRNTLGMLTPGRSDDAYHYYGDMYFPLSRSIGLRTEGRLYDRNGYFVVQPATGNAPVYRSRIDRSLNLSLDRHNEDHTSRTEIGYNHLRQGSTVSGDYAASFNYTGNGMAASREWLSGERMLKAEVSGNYLSYDNGYGEFTRWEIDGAMSLVSMGSGLRHAITAGTRYVQEYRFLPHAAAVMMIEREKLLVSLSVGYSEKAPSLHERYLPYKRIDLYNMVNSLYIEVGRELLVSEKRLVGNAAIELGSTTNNFKINATVGRVWDGIDWQHRHLPDNEGTSTVFSPINDDISFFDLSGGPQISVGDALTVLAGGAYHYIDYENHPERAYQPEFQFFSGGELHLYWSQRLLHLYAYGELVYAGAHTGYMGEALGEVVMANVKLSFRIKNFRFHYVFQNALGNEFHVREGTTNPGRYNYYGITWDFFD